MESLAQHSRGTLNNDASSLQSRNLGVSSTASTGDNGTGVAHSASWWCGDTGNERHDWLASSVVLFQEIGRLLLGRTSNLANHDDTVGLTILEEDAQAVDEVGAGEWVTADTDNEGLSQTGLGGLVDGLIGQCAGAGDNTDAAALVDESWHDTNLALAWCNYTWAVWSDETGLVLGLEDVGDADHVVLWDSLSDTDNKWHLGGDGLLNTGSCDRWWDEDGRCGCAGLLACLLDIGKNWEVEMCTAGLLWVGASNDIGSVLNCLLGVESSLLSSETLEQDARVLVNLQIVDSRSIAGSGVSLLAGSRAQRWLRNTSEGLHLEYMLEKGWS